MSDDQLAALHEMASTAFVVSTEDYDVAEAILLMIFRDRVDEVVTLMTTKESEHTFTVTACCDDGLGRVVRGWVRSTDIANGPVVGVAEIPLSDIVRVHVW